jgi:predicted nucleotidyltransferase component of viral defense system
MIKPGEIQKWANKVGVRDSQIEKDYILSWILCGIANHSELSKEIVFKGGTVLKKVYFDDYRYSEDLDFTLIADRSNDQLKKWFDEVFEYIKEEANIPLEIIDQNDHEDGGMNFYISYIGPFGGDGSNKKVKVDISRSEELVFDPVTKSAIINYSDLPDYQLLCYPLEEVLVEKLRSTIQRLQPRDYYDIWYLLEIHGMEIDFFIPEFIRKCESKGIDPSSFYESMEKRLPQYKGRWAKSMTDQIQELPPFEQVEREMNRQLKKFEV